MNNISSLSLFKTLGERQQDDYYKTQLHSIGHFILYIYCLYHNLCSIVAFKAGLSLG